jgi:hypothetical protein
MTAVSILDVWRGLGGADLRHGRGRAFWRGGNGYNVSVDTDKNAWFDFVANIGGGSLRLVEVALGADRPAALSWLSEHGFIERNDWTVAERREYARRRAQAERLTEVADHWQRGAVHELEHAKKSAFDNGDFAGLVHFAGDLEGVKGLAGAARLEALAESLKCSPLEARRRIRTGRADVRDAERITAVVVALVAPGQERDMCYAA